VAELAELVLDMTGSPSKIIDAPAVIDDPKQRRPDITQAAALLDWAPRIPLSEGLARTIAHFEASIAPAPQRLEAVG
jgi:UDP-glucuronate decarboxylase